MGDLNQRFAQLSPEKRALLVRRLMEKGTSVAGEQAIPRREAKGPRPLSFAQQRLWFLNQLEPDSPAYNMPKAIKMQGRLNLEALRQTLDAIVARHEVLRTTFKSLDGSPLQVIGESRAVALPLIDLSEWADAEREVEVQRLTEIETQRPFDLSRDLMLRATLMRLGQWEHVLLLVQIASDGWSAGVLFREMAALYDAFCADKPSPLPELPIQYADFAHWQREWLQGEVLESQVSYWKQQLAHSPPVLELPTDRPRPAVQTFRGAKQSLVLSKSLTEALKSLSRREGVTLFMTLLAAFQTLLHRYTGQDDIVVGSPIAGRTRVETEELIGPFVNTLVLRTDLSGEPTFRELLRRVREVALGAYDHQDLPFEKLVAELRLDRNLSHSPLFQAMFVLQNTPREVLELPGLILSSLDVRSGTAKFDLTLSLTETELGLQGYLEYNTDLFDTSTIKRMLGHFQTLTKGIIANPDQQVWELPLLTVAESNQLLVEWNDTKADNPPDRCTHELFEAQVERTPDAVALIFKDERLTYHELNRRANQLAHHLRDLGVGPDVLVGICMERSLEMIVGLLGVLKAGGAYVPLDPEYPKPRLAYMLEDTGVRLLLTQERLLDHLPEYKGEVLFLDGHRMLFQGEKESNPEVITRPEHLAYIVYTSGSTGKPKGVLCGHRAVVNYLTFLVKAYGLCRADVVLQLAPLSFDASVRDMIGPLTTGAQVVLVDNTDAKDPATLLSKIKEYSVTCLLSVVPSMLHSWLEAACDKGSLYDSIRIILVSGEVLHLSACQKAKDVFGRRVLVVNQYGPTECTMTSSYYPIAGPRNEEGVAPIGRPIPNSQLYILDGNLSPVPIGVPGELHVGGYGVARGYLKRPELTREKFIRNPFSDELGSRLYKTGDLGRYLPDGNIEFLGRMDNQVKIRGFRVEPGEIEAVLGNHPAVREAVVIAREDIPEDKRLVAYVVPEQEPAPKSSELRSFLQGKLPDYMIPSAFVMLDSLPLTPNGKLDRLALPAPDSARPELQETFVAPRTPVEEVLAGNWADLLRLERVGIHDNFFELGGHSLLATQVISRVIHAFQVEVSLRSLFEAPTIADMAVAIVQKQMKQAAQEDRERMLAELEALSDEEAGLMLVTED